MVFEGKAQAELKAESRLRRDEQFILSRLATQPSGTRWGFESTSSNKADLLD
jgi:hypothetical protein